MSRFSLEDCDYVVTSIGYLDRLYFKTHNDKFKKAIEEWKECEEEARIIYVKDSKYEQIEPGGEEQLVPFEDIIDGTKDEVTKIHNFLSKHGVKDNGCIVTAGRGPFIFLAELMEIDHCANFTMRGLNDIIIIKDDDMSIAYLEFDTESG
jgi:hypothetical protein